MVSLDCEIVNGFLISSCTEKPLGSTDIDMALCLYEWLNDISSQQLMQMLYYNVDIYKVALQYEKPDDIVIPEMIGMFYCNICT